MRKPLAVAALLLGLAARPASPQGFTYSDAPLHRFVPLSQDSLRIAYRGFPEWYSENRSDIDLTKADGLREELYLIIHSFIKYIFDDTGAPYLDSSTSMAGLFDLATDLGVVGAGMVAQRLAPGAADEFAPSLHPDSGMTVEYSHPMFTLRSDHGWSVRYPYFFVLWSANRLNVGNGVSGHVAVWSTLFGELALRAGREQASISVLSSATTPRERFENSWLPELGITFSDEVAETLLPESRLYRAVDKAKNLIKEVVTLETHSGPMIVTYIAQPGPFDGNREHWLDFLRHLEY
jgi:hypothetical protein